MTHGTAMLTDNVEDTTFVKARYYCCCNLRVPTIVFRPFCHRRGSLPSRGSLQRRTSLAFCASRNSSLSGQIWRWHKHGDARRQLGRHASRKPCCQRSAPLSQWVYFRKRLVHFESTTIKGQNKVFKSTTLTTHKRTHTGEKPFQCDFPV